jgi:predicted PurR-regulated permease PerM
MTHDATDPHDEVHTPTRRIGFVDLASLVVIFAGLAAARPIVILLMMSVFLTVLSSPLVRVLVARRVPRPVAVVAVVLGQLGLLSVAGVIIGRAINNLTTRAPYYQELILARLHELTVFLDARGVEVTDSELTSLIDPDAVVSLSSGVIASFASLTSNLALVLLASAFLLLEAPSLHAKLEQVLLTWFEDVDDDPLDVATAQMQRYLVVKTGSSLITGAFAGLTAWAFGLDLALFWGFLAFALNFIPTIGSIIAAFPPVVVALVTLGPGPALAIAIGYLAINTTVGTILEPRLMGRTLGISPVVVLASLFFWGYLFGPVGALLSAPLTMLVKIVCEHVASWRWFAALLAEAE